MSGTFEEKLHRLNELRTEANLGGGQQKIDKIHAKGRLTARERIHLLLDEGSFLETGVFVTHREPSVEVEPVGDRLRCGAFVRQYTAGVQIDYFEAGQHAERVGQRVVAVQGAAQRHLRLQVLQADAHQHQQHAHEAP